MDINAEVGLGDLRIRCDCMGPVYRGDWQSWPQAPIRHGERSSYLRALKHRPNFVGKLLVPMHVRCRHHGFRSAVPAHI
jgi:hypothetical protein